MAKENDNNLGATGGSESYGYYESSNVRKPIQGSEPSFKNRGNYLGGEVTRSGQDGGPGGAAPASSGGGEDLEPTDGSIQPAPKDKNA